jgi:hypothetical protein
MWGYFLLMCVCVRVRACVLRACGRCVRVLRACVACVRACVACVRACVVRACVRVGVLRVVLCCVFVFVGVSYFPEK